MTRELVVTMTACGTGLVTESSTIILVPERKGRRKEQPPCCTDTTWCLEERVGKMLVLGCCVARVVLVAEEHPRNVCIRNENLEVGREHLPPKSSGLAGVGVGAPKPQNFTLSECKLGLCGASRALAANNKAGIRLERKVARSLGRGQLLEGNHQKVL